MPIRHAADLATDIGGEIIADANDQLNKSTVSFQIKFERVCVIVCVHASVFSLCLH
jgi:hypothetical protein